MLLRWKKSKWGVVNERVIYRCGPESKECFDSCVLRLKCCSKWCISHAAHMQVFRKAWEREVFNLVLTEQMTLFPVSVVRDISHKLLLWSTVCFPLGITLTIFVCLFLPVFIHYSIKLYSVPDAWLQKSFIHYLQVLHFCLEITAKYSPLIFCCCCCWNGNHT